METVSSIPAHLLLNRKQDTDSKSEQSAETGPASAFAQYTFGPLDLSGGKSVASGSAVTNATGSTSGATGGSTSWMAQLYT